MASVTCPSCGAILRLPESASGRPLKCPKCQASIVAPSAIQSNKPIQDFEPSPASVAPSPRSAERAGNVCPFCNEAVKIGAKKCKHCGETIDVSLRAAEEAKRSSAGSPSNVATSVSNSNSAAASVVVNARGFPHLLHIILCIVTCGLWLPVYGVHLLMAKENTIVGTCLIVVPILFGLFGTAAMCAGCGGCTYIAGRAVQPNITVNAPINYPKK